MQRQLLPTSTSATQGLPSCCRIGSADALDRGVTIVYYPFRSASRPTPAWLSAGLPAVTEEMCAKC